MCCGVFTGEIHVQNIGEGKVQTYRQQILYNTKGNIHVQIRGIHQEEQNLGGYPNQTGKTEGFDPGLFSKYTAPEGLGEDQNKSVHNRH